VPAPIPAARCLPACCLPALTTTQVLQHISELIACGTQIMQLEAAAGA
jgi:hypothetical protein